MMLLTRLKPYAWLALIAGVTALYFAWQTAEADRIEQKAANKVLAKNNVTLRQERDFARNQVAVMERAAVARAADEAALSTMSKDLNNAIDKAAIPGTAPGPATTALGCARLRQAGSTAAPAYRRICG